MTDPIPNALPCEPPNPWRTKDIFSSFLIGLLVGVVIAVWGVLKLTPPRSESHQVLVPELSDHPSMTPQDPGRAFQPPSRGP